MTPSMPKVRILYVDDDIENLNSFKAVFRRIYDVHLAGSAQEALNILRETDIQVLITDQRMPGMTGTELLEQVAALYPDILRYMLTGFSDFDPLVDAINKGKLLGYFSKPIDHEFIRSRIEEGLKRHYLELKNQNLLEKIRENERFLNAVIENIPDMIFVKDAENLSFVRFNRAGETLVGLPAEDMIGKTDYDFFPEEDADIFTRKDREVLETRQLMDIPEESIQTRFQGKRWLHTKKIPILGADGNPLYLLGVSRDITEYRAMMENEKKLQAQLLQAQKMEAIGTLAGGIAHDFNNILSAVIGYTELAQMKLEVDSEIKNDLKEVLAAGVRAKDLVNQILSFSRQTQKEQTPVQMGLIVIEALKLIRSSLPTTIDIRQNIQSQSVVLSDPTQLHQIVMNLCTNAAHAMREKGGILEIVLTDVEIDSDFCLSHPEIQPGSFLKLSVSDTGHGMTADVMKQIFDPFFTTKLKGEGTGLGLSVVHGIVKDFGGMLTVYSEPDKGTVFNLYLPIIKGRAEELPEELTIIPTGTERILVVDDQKVIVDIIKNNLLSLGYAVETRNSSLAALELFKAMPDKFDLVITDMTMPQMTGDVLAQELMKIRPDLPVILCTGFSENITKEKAKTMGIKAFLLKPLLREEIAHTIRKVLDDDKKRS